MRLQPPRMQGPFVARFMTYTRVPAGRDLRVRFACAVDPGVQQSPWFVAEAIRNVFLATRSADGPESSRAREIVNQSASAPPERLADSFSPSTEIWFFSGLLSVDELPADVRPTGSGNQWAIPPDLYLSEVFSDGGTTGRVTFVQLPAASVIERQRQRIQAAERKGGVRVTAALVQANNVLFRPGTDNQPAVVVYSPDPNVTIARLRQLSRMITGLKGVDQTDPDLAMLSEYVTNEMSCPFRRRPLPKRLTGGAEVYVADLKIYREFLPGGVLRGRDTLVCVAEPGARGGALELLEENRR